MSLRLTQNLFEMKLTMSHWFGIFQSAFFCSILVSAHTVAAQNIGINTTVPSQRLEVNGKIKVGNDNNAPAPGTLRWNTSLNDLEVYDGIVWRSLTLSSQSLWGNNQITESQKILSSDLSSGDLLGFSVAIHDDYIIVGAPSDDTGSNSGQGSAYIFFYNGSHWVQQAKLTAADGNADDSFGNSVSIHGNYCIVGANQDDNGNNNNQGSAYIFIRNGTTWTQQAKLTASDGASNDLFGYSVSINGDYCVISSPSDDIGATVDQGSAYIFQRTGGTFWTQTAKLTASDGAASDLFGISVAMDGFNVVVGSYLDDIGGNIDQGSAYLFSRTGTTWSQDNKFLPFDSGSGIEFGYHVAIQGNTIAIGSPKKSTNINVQGAVYIWRNNSLFWSFHSKIYPVSGDLNGYFGYSVSISGEYVAIGSPGANNNVGTAYLYLLTNNEYKLQSKLIHSSGNAFDYYGFSIHMTANHIVIAAPYSGGSTQGAAFIYSKNY